MVSPCLMLASGLGRLLERGAVAQGQLPDPANRMDRSRAQGSARPKGRVILAITEPKWGKHRPSQDLWGLQGVDHSVCHRSDSSLDEWTVPK
jgi:hypothetical protein